MPYPGWTLAIGGFLAIASFIPIGFVACSRRFGFSSPHANYEAGSPLKRIDTNASNNPMIHVSSPCSRKFNNVNLRPTMWKLKNLIATQFYVKSILPKFESLILPFLQF